MARTLGLQSIVFITYLRGQILLTTSSTDLLFATERCGVPLTGTWRSVTIELWIPYLLVSRTTIEDGESVMKTIVMWMETEILDFWDSSDVYEILDVALLFPSDELSSARWKLVPIQEVRKEKYANDSGHSITYLTVENEIVMGHARTGPEAVSVQSTLLYRIL